MAREASHIVHPVPKPSTVTNGDVSTGGGAPSASPAEETYDPNDDPDLADKV